MIGEEFINAFVEPGSHIIDVLCEASLRVSFCHIPMRFEFNGVTVIFSPGKKVSEVYLMYMEKMGGNLLGEVAHK